MSIPSRTLSVTFLYDHTGGFYVGVLPGGAQFKFVAPPESNIPTKLINALRSLQVATVADHEARTGEKIAKKEVDLSQLDQKISEFNKRHGGATVLPTRGGPRKAKAKKEKVTLSLEDLGL